MRKKYNKLLRLRWSIKIKPNAVNQIIENGGITIGTFNLLELQKNLKNLGIMISFSGGFSQGIIEELSEAIEKHLSKENLAKGNIYHVISIFVEQAQNIRNYTSGKENTLEPEDFERIATSGIVTIGKDQEGYYIYSGNYIQQKDMQELNDKLENLSKLNKEELKKFYKEQLRKSRDNQTSAGLGLIDIFRKATYPVQYSFNDYNQELKFYSLKVTV